MRYLFLFLFMCMLLPEGGSLAAQNRHDSLREAVTQTSWNITASLMAEDGNRLILRKRSWIPAFETSDLDKDSILFFNLQKRGRQEIAGIRQGVRRIAFVDNHRVLLTGRLQTELFDLEGQKSNYYKGVEQTRVLSEKKQFVLHYGVGENNRLELRSADGELLNEIENVVSFYTTESGNIYAIVGNEEDIFEIFLLGEKKKDKVYGTAHKIVSLEIDPDEEGCMIVEQYPENSSQSLLYLDVKNSLVYPLKEVLPLSFQRVFTEEVGDGNTYFLKLMINKSKKDGSLVDIWYGNDNRLEEKFYPPVQEANFVWESKKKSVQQIGTGLVTLNACIGNERYFLSFDPYLLQDYSREQALLQIQVYDRILNRYSIMDTIAPTLYPSGNGEYVLSQKNKIWHLYHLPSGSKKTLYSEKNIGIPWFTDDGNAILFEGDEGLWKYDLNTGLFSQIADFDGYQTKIINGTTKSFSVSKCNIRGRQVNLLEPLVIQLYDLQKYVTSYVLWHKGNIKPIIAPTAKHIQSLKYNKTYTHFNYIEEDYNMPPRLVYKKPGEDERIVYESNKEDKAIFSLTQEIIPYTNSDGIPLNGILYYPLNYNPSGKYPMVVHIYEKQRHLVNRYPYPSYYESLGFNIRLLLENGYFVYLPDILIQGKDGPGMDALDCVHNALDALAGNPLIDKHKIGLIGHSFGGYEVNFIATHSTRFAAYVSGAGHSDIIWAYHAFNYNFHFPDHVRIEANIYKMGIPFSLNKALYFENNPVYRAEDVNAPVLLWTGTEDQNVTANHSMAFYNALRKNNKHVIGLFYPKEGHALQNKEAQFDLTARIVDWFDYFLKNEKGIEWIGME